MVLLTPNAGSYEKQSWWLSRRVIRGYDVAYVKSTKRDYAFIYNIGTLEKSWEKFGSFIFIHLFCHRKGALCALVRCFGAVPYW